MKLLRRVSTGFPDNQVFSRLWAKLKRQKIKANVGKINTRNKTGVNHPASVPRR